MSPGQYLLLKLGEECSEVTKEAAKQSAFGRDTAYYDEPNHVRLRSECLDVLVCILLLEHAKEIEPISYGDVLKHYRSKRERVMQTAANAISAGTVEATLYGRYPEL